MLSDVLSETVERIDAYLAEFGDTYGGEIRERIIKARDELHAIRCELDMVPTANDANENGAPSAVSDS